MVSILHISDLHFTRDAAMHNMRQIVLDEAREKVHDKPRGDKLLVVTGDFHNFWAKDYQDAIKFLDELIVAMDIDPKEDVFIVPGNHDVGNDTALGALLESEDPNWKKHNKAAVVMLQNGDMDYIDERLHAFRQYSGFAIELGVYDSKQGIDFPSQVHIRRWRDKLNILHLNTALIADGKAKDNQIADITTATDPILWKKWYRDDLPALALGHNSFYDMAEAQQYALETMFAQKNISAYLCGDTHLRNLSPNKARIPIQDGEIPIPNVVCAKSVADMSDDYSDFGYYWHEWDEKTDDVTAMFYRWRPEYQAETAAEGIPIKYKMRRKAAPEKTTPPKTAAMPKPEQVVRQDPEAELRTYLAGVLERKRDSHPSFKLMKVDEIDSRLFPKVEEYSEIPPRGRIKEDASDSKSDNCLVWDIIRSSWKEDEHRSVVIIGEGGIGKTVTLFSITRSAEGTESVPALYIPMYELVDKDGNLLDLTAFFTAKYKKYGEQIETLATTPWKERPQILILLDGFNEVPNLLRRSVLSEINDWHDTHPGAQLIAVSRPMDGLNLSKELAGNPIPVTLALLDTGTVSAYLKEAGRRIPSPNAPIWEDLRYPLFLNLYIKTGRLKGETPAGYPLHVVEADSGGALIWNFLQRELLRQKTDKDEKAAAWVIRCAVANEYILPFIAYHMVSTQRMDISFDEAEKLTKEALDLLDRGILPKHLKQIWEKHKRGPKGTYPERGMFTEQIWRDTVLRDSGVLVSSARKHGENDDIPEDAYYSFMHQNFRDCLAGLYLVNQAETCSDKKYPKVWQHGQSHLALKYAAELMDADTAKNLWETNRKLQQYTKPGYVKNHTATCTLLELQKQRKPLPDALDFSGMDLSGLSLTRYLRKGETDLKLFGEARLTRNTKLDRRTFQSDGHINWVNCVAVLSDGRVVSGSWDCTLRVWDAATGQCLQTLEGHTNVVTCVTDLQDRWVVSGSRDGTLRVWDVATGQCLQTLKGHTNWVNCVSVLPDGRVVSGSYDNTVRVWNATSGQCLQTLGGHFDCVNCIAILPDGRVVSGSSDGTLRVWDATTGHCLQKLERHFDFVNCVAVLSDGRVVSGSKDHTLRAWNTATGHCSQILKGHTDSISCIAVLPDGRVVSGSKDHTLRVWDMTRGQCLQTLKGHTGSISCVAALPDGRVVSGSRYRTLQVWDTVTGQNLQTLEGHTDWIRCVAVLPDGRVISSSDDRTLRVWDVASGQSLQTLEGVWHSNWANCVAVLPDGRVVSGSDDRILRVWDVSIGQSLQTLEGHTDWIRCVAVLPDGRVVSGSNDHTLRVWDAATGQSLQSLVGHTGLVKCVAVLPDGRVVSGSNDRTLRVWDAATGQSLQPLVGHTGLIECVAVLLDGRVVSGSNDRTLRVWDVATGQSQQSLAGHKNWISCVAILPDGRVVSGSLDRTLRVWDATTGQCLQILEGHTGPIYCVAVLLDGRVISGSSDHTLRVWDTTTGQCMQTLKGLSPISCIAVLPDGRVVSGSDDRTLRVLDADTGECIDILEAMEIRVSQWDFSKAILTEDLARLLWQNGAMISDEEYTRWVKPSRKLDRYSLIRIEPKSIQDENALRPISVLLGGR